MFVVSSGAPASVSQPPRSSVMSKLFVVVLFLLIALCANAQTTPKRRHINLPGRNVNAPFSDAVLVGDTLYLAGRIGLDAKTGKVPGDAEQEARNVLEQFKLVLAQVGMTMDDLVTVQVFCPDLALFDKWNGVYRSYFGKDFPARAFIGSGPLLFNAHFEMQGVAVKEGAGKAALKSGKKSPSAQKKTAGNSKAGM
jgi:2-iminobutanoate/2-iminopropanoate deaminase